MHWLCRHPHLNNLLRPRIALIGILAFIQPVRLHILADNVTSDEEANLANTIGGMKMHWDAGRPDPSLRRSCP